MDLTTLFIGFHPIELFGDYVSVETAELIIVFGTVAANLGILVWLGNWWSR